ncbi:DUF2945 domain-containing protein [Stutzerimonas nosocomialis]|uniref:DUF2945 domain-containing protein n=1 Tax=Stutzerimonas nosocomialis TaxID=1056496 RepID=A0A5R9QF49_9GAMM|nr:DUF2945 domain-containing protein [Stutzerimonas nosocomialis]TLX53653.1 DUF2945 domain-containing protein [Stutzerimonas nosocomialis]TLX55019.1 DUF2945 domain-containing protein [Stutzerimonas nosocomialis]TLX63538.1 DUF2945 domain-containing protein [Stutzerimonas nosocomialis]
MSQRYKSGEKVKWNSEAGWILGEIVKVHTSDTEFMGRTRRASPEEPQYEVRSARTGHLAMHKESALHRVTE